MPDLCTIGFRVRDLGPLDFVVHGGECVALGGPSGAGKSLFLRAIADLDPHEGDARLDGEAASSMPAPEWRRRVGFLPAEPRWWRASVGEHFAAEPGPSLRAASNGGGTGDRRAASGRSAAADRGAGNDAATRSLELIERLGFPRDVLGWPVERLSSGETQRLAIARLLERRPEALLLDEPTAHLDERWTRVVEAIVAEYRTGHGVPVLWVTHDVEQAGRVASRRFELVDGRLAS